MTGLRLRMVAVAALSGLVVAALARAGSGVLAGPSTASWSGTVRWYEEVGAATATVALVRLVAAAGVAWLGVGAVLQLVASLSPARSLDRLARAMSPRVLRRLAHGAAGLSVSAGLSLTAPAAVSALPADDPPGTAVMEVVDDPPPETQPPASPPVQTPSSPVPPGIAAPDVTSASEVTVDPGDSFWSIAAEAVAEVQGARPTDQQVLAYWQRLIEANRDRLVAPRNPDLLLPGQVLVVPEVEIGA